MKLHYQKLFISFAALFSLFTATAQDGALRHIPVRTTQIVQVDLKQFKPLMKWEEVLQLPALKELQENKEITHDAKWLKYINDPSATGIDLEAPLYVFTHVNNDSYMEGYRGVAGKIKNLQKFTAWVLEVNKTIALTKPGRVKTLATDKVSYVWDTEHFMLFNDYGARFSKTLINADTATLSMLKKAAETSDTAAQALSSLMKFYGEPAPLLINEVMAGFEENATAPVYDNRMIALFNQKEPVKVWNQRAMPGSMGPLFNPINMLLNDKENRDKSFIAAASTLHFDNGRVLYNSHAYLNEALKKYFPGNGPSFDMSLAKNIDLQKLVGFMTLKINTPLLGDFLAANFPKEEGSFKKLRIGGPETADMLAAFTGDLLLACTEPGNRDESVPPGITALLKIKDIPAAERVLGKLKAENENSLRKKTWMQLDDSKTMLVISTTQESAERLLAKKDQFNDTELETLIKANPLFLQVNINELYPIMMRMESPKNERGKMIAEMLSSLQQLRFTIGKNQQDGLYSGYELSFNNKEDNGFRQMMLMYDKLIRSTFSFMAEPETIQMQMPRESVTIDGKIQEVDVPAPPPPPMFIPKEKKVSGSNPEGPQEEIMITTPNYAKPVARKKTATVKKNIKRKS